jgi:hypothetical protein
MDEQNFARQQWEWSVQRLRDVKHSKVLEEQQILGRCSPP